MLSTFFVVLSLLFALNQRIHLAALILGVAGSFKLYPFLLLPFLAILGGYTVRERIKLVVIGLVPGIVTIFPFLFSRSFREIVLFSGLSGRVLVGSIDLGFGDGLIIFVGVYCLLLYLAISKKVGQIDKIWIYFLRFY